MPNTHLLLLLSVVSLLAVSSAEWTQVVGAGDFASNRHNTFYREAGETGWRYGTDASSGPIVNMYERASTGVRGAGSYSVADDFSVPSGMVAQKVMLALQGVRSFNLETPLNPLFVLVGIVHHNSTHDGPDHWQPAIKWFNLSAPVGDWHNMSRDVPAANTNPTSTGIIEGAYDWFALDVSDVNGGQGLGEGHYWFTIMASVKDHSTYDAKTNSWSIGNNYAVAVSIGTINLPNGGILQGRNPGFGSAAKLPYMDDRDMVSYSQDIPVAYIPSVSWKRTPTCAYDPTGACDLSMLVFLWADSLPSNVTAFQGPVPPRTCTRNTVPYTPSTAEPSQYALPAYACPGKYYDSTDATTPAVGSSPSSSSAPVSTVPVPLPPTDNPAALPSPSSGGILLGLSSIMYVNIIVAVALSQ